MAPRVLRRILAAALIGAAAPACAADLGIGPQRAPEATEGVPSGSPVVQSFESVWQGHFTGGYSHYLGPGDSIVLDWRDEKLCFPTHRACDRYVHDMRRDFHRPEGYFSCFVIR